MFISGKAHVLKGMLAVTLSAVPAILFSGGAAYGADLSIASYASQSYTTYNYQIADGDYVDGNGDKNTIRVRNAPTDANAVRLYLSTTSTYDQDSFHFLQNGYCIGSCYATATTTLSVDITNNGATPLDLRFDSIITPGHLAAQSFNPDLGSDTNANFDFRVTQQDGGPNAGPTPTATELYSAQGYANFQEISIDTSDDQRFNGLTYYGTSSQQVLDWSATNLNLVLATLGAGQTTRITYTTTTSMFGSSPECTRLATCDGAQVAFGDPRKNGSATLARSAFGAQASDPQPVIGREFYTADVPFEVVLADAPLPPEPEVLPPVDYASFSAPVPEPDMWAMLMTGFAALGIALRRRRMSLRAA